MYYIIIKISKFFDIKYYYDGGEIIMNKNKYTVLTKKDLLETNGGKVKIVGTDASYYPRKWSKELGKWIVSKI